MQQTDRVAVLATQLARADRRALSQAWYSALHLAGDAARSRPPRLAIRGPALPRAPQLAAAGVRREGAPAPARLLLARVPKPAPARAAQAEQPERRAPKTTLARRIERGVQAQGRRPGTGSFAVRDERARVHVVVRTSGGVTRVMAVCEPALRERVERALAQARFALAGHGVRVEPAR